MRNAGRVLAVTALFAFAMVVSASAQVSSATQTCSYTLFKVLQGSTPGIGGINDYDVVSGSVQQGQTVYGFIRHPGGALSTFLINSRSNYASKINNQGTVVGSYYPTSTQEGYRRTSSGQVLTIKDPNGANGTAAHGINNAGEIVGWFDTSAALQEGFIYLNGNFTTFYHSGWSFMQPEAVNKYGAIVGSYMDSNSKMHGFLYANGKWATLNFPGASNTDALGINDAGEIVGWYLPSGSSTSQGFVYKNGTYSTVLVNGKPSISVDGVNNLGHIYGDALGTSFIGKNCH